MNNVLQLNYYEEHQKYEGGNGIKFLIDKTNIIGSSSNFAIFGRSSNFCNTKAWQNIFTNHCRRFCTECARGNIVLTVTIHNHLDTNLIGDTDP